MSERHGKYLEENLKNKKCALKKTWNITPEIFPLIGSYTKQKRKSNIRMLKMKSKIKMVLSFCQ
ncbi:unnamed protein product [Wuchereria bancrofti]|uniref:Uncharacterized protein n=1 Tax=Wuchereria bancrofti TaxID=6293 RepID=A0A3P7EEY7_WUCBA|nr:unnamed protein product [Wuchereria bancrofti]